MFANIQGLCTRNKAKIPFISELANEDGFQFISLVETHLTDEIHDAEIEIQNYTPFRADRRDRSHGGALIYLRQDLVASCEILNRYSNSVCELICVHVKQINTIIATIYRPPNSNLQKFEGVITSLINSINQYNNTDTEIFILGDFNFPTVNWEELSVANTTNDEKRQINLLLDMMEEHNLTQLIRTPTRGNNILDLLIIRSPEIIHSYETTDSAISDHRIITFQKYCNTKELIGNERKSQLRGLKEFNYFHKSIQWDTVREELGKEELRRGGAEETLKDILSKCYDISDTHIPRKKTINKLNKIPRDRRILMKKRKALKIKLGKPCTREKYRGLVDQQKQIEEKILISHKKEAEDEENKAIETIKSNTKYFFSYAKKKQKIKNQIGPFTSENGSLITDSFEMAEKLRQQYEKSFSTPEKTMTITDPEEFFSSEEAHDTSLTDFDFTVQDITDAIMSLHSTSSPGPDGMPVIMLKECRTILAPAIHHLWRHSLDTGVIPKELKSGIITPIHKGGSRGEPANYRPVVLTSFITKIFEKIVRSKIVEYMERKQLFNEGQHGFRKGRSCLSQLLTHYEHVLDHLDQDENVDVVYLDFAKAFDKVDHGILLHKIKSIGVTGKIGKWLHSFLTERDQKVAINGIVSNPSKVKSGVPQGSVLGPLLFLIMIGDIDTNTENVKVTSFADDTRITFPVSSKDDRQILQDDLNKIYKWTQENNLAFNTSKFVILRYGRDKDLKDNNYTSPDGRITEEENTRDLGIILSADATFKSHIKNTVVTAKRLSNWILRTFRTRKEVCMLTLWKSLVVPKLEYCCQLWNPGNTGDVEDIEALQRTFTSKIDTLKGKNYWERLKALNLFSLQRRRERYLIIYTWRILEKQVPNPGVQMSKHQSRGRTCYIKGYKTNNSKLKSIQNNSFVRAGSRLFNSLPTHIRNTTQCSVESFKRRLDKFLLKIEDTPPLPTYQTWPHYNKLEKRIPIYLREVCGSNSGTTCS